MLRWRCDARVFKPLLIEIIARQKVTPAFEPQKVSGRTGPGRACKVLFGKLSKVQSVDQRMYLECGAGFRQLRTGTSGAAMGQQPKCTTGIRTLRPCSRPCG